MESGHILTLSCPDTSGIVHRVTGLLASANHNIADLQQFSDPVSNKFFMRVHFQDNKDTSESSSTEHLVEPFNALAAEYKMDYEIQPATRKTRVLVMVSKIGHCLNDLLYRMKVGQLRIEIPLIVSNHPEFADLAKSYNIPFFHLPVTKETKPQQEQSILDLCKEHSIELIVLARYMQVLSPVLCNAMPGRIINIHHSFLPSFKGAKPYHQAYERGVKIIGATAHFATENLDEGPIIEQQVARVNHGMEPKALTVEGSKLECSTLTTGIKWFAERRIFLDGVKTVVFA